MARDTWCRLVQDFCLLGAGGKTKVVARSREVIHTLLHFRISDAVKSTIIRKEELSQSRLRLNTPPSVLYFSWMSSSLSCETS